MTGEAVERLVEAIVHVVETLIDEEGPFVAQLKSERSKGQTAQDSKGTSSDLLLISQSFLLTSGSVSSPSRASRPHVGYQGRLTREADGQP